MAKWSLKNRNTENTDNVPNMPPELSDYYNAEKRDRMWATWLLGFATLVVTVLLAVLLFLGGRWVIDQITGDDEVDVPVTTTQNEPTDDTDADQTDDTTRDTETDNANDDTVAGTTDEDSDDQESGVVTDVAAVTDEPLPDTGPADTLAVFLSVTVLAALAHNRLQRQNSHQ